MTTEQKAKAYDEALKMAKKELKVCGSLDCDAARQIFRFFPALKESEDERIRKELIDFVKSRGGFKQEYIAWLEKQVPIDEEKVLIGARKDVALSIMNFLDRNTLGMDLSSTECADLESAVIDSDWSKVYNYMKKKLEKQGEQKPFDYENANIRQKDFAPKIEPKFKVGEWITNGEYTWKIVEVKPLDYILQSQDGNIVDDTISYVDEQFHSITIEDAKDGNALQETVSEDLNRAAVEYAFTTPTTIVESYIAGANWQKEQMLKDAVERVKKKMITRAIAWVEWNNRNGSCLFDGWKESLREAMKGE